VPGRRALQAATFLAAIAASPVAAQERTTVGGYGEIHYTNPTGPATPATVNLSRFVVYLSHTFSDRLTFASELEVEDAKIEAGAAGGEVGIEQAYLDYRLNDWLTLRTGLILASIILRAHEPPTFNGVERPLLEHDVIPTTWREIGLGAVGPIPGVEGLSYRLYVLNGLKAEGFTGSEGIREGRQEGQNASFANPSLTGRIEWARPGLRIGGSFWYGGTANADSVLGTGHFAAPMTLLSADARYEIGGASFRAVVATISVSDAAAINARYGADVGSRISGGYVEAAYNLLTLLAPQTPQQLNAFVRYEQYDTQSAVPVGTVQDPALARRITTVGLTYRPTHNTAFKGDYQLLRNRAGAGEGEVLSLGIGYEF
jgi:hypothetical protein